MTEAPSQPDYARAYDTLDFLMGAVEAEAFRRVRPRTRTAALSAVLVTGFLGAGKTTLMRRLVSGDHGLRLAAIVNDVANLNVDAALVADAGAVQGVETLALENGCVCCSQSGSVARMLTEIQAWPDPPDCVVLEASGVADPAALAAVVGGMQGVRLDVAVAVVDAAACDGTCADTVRLIERGVRAADLILINKTDLVAPDAAAGLEHDLSALAPKAAIVRTVDCAVPAGLIFDQGQRGEKDWSAAPALADDRFVTVALRQTRALARRDIERLIATAPAGLYRAKGALNLSDASAPELLQAVGRRWRWAAAEPAMAPLSGRLVLIAGADTPDIAAHFKPGFV